MKRFAHTGNLMPLTVLILIAISQYGVAWGQDLDQYFRQFQADKAAARYSEAERLARQVLEMVSAQGNSIAIGNWSTNLGNVLSDAGRYEEAAQFLKQSLAIREQTSGAHDPIVAASLNNLALVFKKQGQYANAELLHKRALAIEENALGPDDPGVADSLDNLANVIQIQGRLAEAEPLYKRGLAIREQRLGPDHPDVAYSLNNLAILCVIQGRYVEAEPLYKRAVTIKEKGLGPDHPDVANSLNNLAILYVIQGRYAEAEPLHGRAVAIRERRLGPEHPVLAASLNNLANVYENQGRYVEAELLHKRALAIKEKWLGPEHPEVAASLNNLANIYESQGRYVEAEQMYRRSLAIGEKALGAEHPELATSLNNLAHVDASQGRFAEAEGLYKRVLSIRAKGLGPEHPDLAASLNNLAILYCVQHRYAEADLLYERALAITEKGLGADNPGVATSLANLGSSYYEQGKSAEAAPLVDRAVAIQDRAKVGPGHRSKTSYLRARIAWKANRRNEAITDLEHALDFAEQQRGRSAAAEQERATSFARYASVFERMVEWQTVLGNPGEAFQAIERARTQSLLEQMDLGAVDLLAGLPPDQAAELNNRRSSTRARISQLEARLRLPSQRSGLSPEQRDGLRAELEKARNDYLEAYRDIRSASPAYRLNLTKDRKPVTLPAVRDWAKVQDALILEYLLGDEFGFVLIVSPDGGPSRVEKLVLTAVQAGKLGVDAGPLTASRMRTVLSNDKGTGILQRITSAGSAHAPVDQLATLWGALVPESEQKAILEGRLKRLVLIPDGPLALFPFESLVVEGGTEPKYLLDAGPPVLYAPSATVLYNLIARPPSPALTNREPVLAVGDPVYSGTGSADPTPTISLAALTARSRYSGVGGQLPRLPYSGWEAKWVVKDYNDTGINAASLSGATATERGVRYWSPGRRVVHLACHGLADQQHGNFFGALALTPGPKGPDDPSDDGYLTLPEIYDLDLKGCELAILSACQTNYGPQQKGEGTWALSRGFLVAGSRRVVASNWLVDDEASATLVHYFCGGLARAEKEGKLIDHAEALQAAKRWVRQQEKWKSPYYWASMVLIGPP